MPMSVNRRTFVTLGEVKLWKQRKESDDKTTESHDKRQKPDKELIRHSFMPGIELN
jgi:hypothetical protein